MPFRRRTRDRTSRVSADLVSEVPDRASTSVRVLRTDADRNAAPERARAAETLVRNQVSQWTSRYTA